MNEKELRKLRRQDLLQLLLLQSRETSKLEKELATLEQAHLTMQDSRQKLMDKLDAKDEEIAWMRQKLDEKERELTRLRAASIRLHGGGEISLDALLDSLRESLKARFVSDEPDPTPDLPAPDEPDPPPDEKPPDEPDAEPPGETTPPEEPDPPGEAEEPADLQRILQSQTDPHRLENNIQERTERTEIEKTEIQQGGKP